MSCGCVVLCGSGAGDVQGALDGRGSFGYKGEGCSCLDFGSRMGASVYLGPAAEAACRNGSTAAGCPESPCPIFPPRSCNTMYCRYIRKEFGKFTVQTVVFSPPVDNLPYLDTLKIVSLDHGETERIYCSIIFYEN